MKDGIGVVMAREEQKNAKIFSTGGEAFGDYFFVVKRNLAVESKTFIASTLLTWWWRRCSERTTTMANFRTEHRKSQSFFTKTIGRAAITFPALANRWPVKNVQTRRMRDSGNAHD
jgi:hypothetical protein